MKPKHTKPIDPSMLDVGSWNLRLTVRLPSSILVLLLPGLLALPTAGQAQFNVTTNDGTIINAAFYGANLVSFMADFGDGKSGATNVDSVFADPGSNSRYQWRLPLVNSASGHRLPAQFKEWAVSQFPDEPGNEISYRLAPQGRTEAGDKPALISRPGLELRAVKPINVVQSKMYPGVEYNGILVQAVRSNPLQLINPFAPAIYGNGEANTVRNLVTSEAEGLKLLQISF